MLQFDPRTIGLFLAPRIQKNQKGSMEVNPEGWEICVPKWNNGNSSCEKD